MRWCSMKKKKIEEEVMITMPGCLMMRSWNSGPTTPCVCVCVQDRHGEREIREYKKKISRERMITASPPPIFNTTQRERWELECKVFLSFSWSISVSLCNLIHTHTHTHSPSITLYLFHHGVFKPIQEVFLASLAQPSSFYIYMYHCSLSVFLHLSLLIKCPITFSFRSADFNTYYHGPIKYCSLHPQTWEHYYFTWSLRRSQCTHTRRFFCITTNQLNKRFCSEVNITLEIRKCQLLCLWRACVCVWLCLCVVVCGVGWAQQWKVDEPLL